MKAKKNSINQNLLINQNKLKNPQQPFANMFVTATAETAATNTADVIAWDEGAVTCVIALIAITIQNRSIQIS